MSVQPRMEVGRIDEAVPVGKASRVFFFVLELWYVSSWKRMDTLLNKRYVSQESRRAACSSYIKRVVKDHSFAVHHLWLIKMSGNFPLLQAQRTNRLFIYSPDTFSIKHLHYTPVVGLKESRIELVHGEKVAPVTGTTLSTIGPVPVDSR